MFPRCSRLYSRKVLVVFLVLIPLLVYLLKGFYKIPHPFVTLDLRDITLQNSTSREVTKYLETCVNNNLPACKIDQLEGQLPTNMSQVSLVDLHAEEEQRFLDEGGWWSPSDCCPQHHVSVVIPFRDRDHHLPILLRQLVPIMRRRKYHFRVFVMDQNENFGFNKGKLCNVGYKESLGYFPYTCFVFHDVDLIPENDGIYYGCEFSPAHLSESIDKFNYELQFDYGRPIFGGIQMFTREHYEMINGNSNSFYHWGGEDDNLIFRVGASNLTIQRQAPDIVRYKMIKHTDNTNLEQELRWGFAVESKNYLSGDGLTNLQYSVKQRQMLKSHTRITVDLQRNLEKEFGKFEYGTDDYLTKWKLKKAS